MRQRARLGDVGGFGGIGQAREVCERGGEAGGEEGDKGRGARVGVANEDAGSFEVGGALAALGLDGGVRVDVVGRAGDAGGGVGEVVGNQQSHRATIFSNCKQIIHLIGGEVGRR